MSETERNSILPEGFKYALDSLSEYSVIEVIYTIAREVGMTNCNVLLKKTEEELYNDIYQAVKKEVENEK